MSLNLLREVFWAVKAPKGLAEANPQKGTKSLPIQNDGVDLMSSPSGLPLEAYLFDSSKGKAHC